MATDKIKVAVRVRPFNRRELELNTQCVVEMESQQTILQQPSDKMDRKQPKTFAFDHCFFSLDPCIEKFASQDVVFNCLGRDILDNAFQGYNACIFAYGQTGSGKSYTMMGTQDNKGIIPRLCDSLFDLIAKQQSSELMYKVEVSYMEIYNEKVHDLLDPKTNKQSLKVREHNVLGPYVDGLSQLAVTAFQDIDNLMTEGNKSRTVAATNMNSESSRSHAVFTVLLTQILTDIKTGVSGEKVSRMSLVDLAGSERAVKTGAVGERLKEGSNINKSLTTLGLVISKLADQSSGNNKTIKDKFVPYRDSVLTWLLKDNLGGNSKTVMVATISPSADNYEETLSTLRYADRAKRIVNHAVVNEDPNARIIRELRQEVETLKEMLKHATGSPVGDIQRVDIHKKLSQSEKLMKEMSQTWEEKLVKTERIQNERQQALEKMGISVQASGIKVEKNKYYLVNLNADPSLNELLVYYLKERTVIGARGAPCEPDIQLSGLGIHPEHCEITIEDGGLFLKPFANARSFVNGSHILDRILLHNGDRIVWGNHHFFRVNCPKAITAAAAAATSEPQTPAQTIDYNFARDELMLNELSNDPIQTAIARLEKQHEEDKQVALEKQRQEYERQFQQLRNIMSPSTPYPPYVPYDPLRLGKFTPCTPTTQMKVEKWAQERDEMFKRSLGQLKADILRANSLVQEANFLAEEMKRQTKFSVTLQIPPANLSPNRKRGSFVSEPAILVKRITYGSQVWSMEKLENKLIDMREMYEDEERRGGDQMGGVMNTTMIASTTTLKETIIDPFYESQENHNLIGVANIFLESLFHDVRLDYHTPIISQQGEVAGRLQVELSRIAGVFPQDRICEAASESSSDSSHEDDELNNNNNTSVTCRVAIKQASGLPLSLSHFVFCQYTFWNHPEPIVVAPFVTPDSSSNRKPNGHRSDSMSFKFDHTKDFTITINEEFVEHCTEGALSIEVWGHRSAGFSRTKPGWEVEQQLAKARSLADRWSELSRKIELWIEIQELNDQGDYTAVEVNNKPEMPTGGVYQLRQGQQRRIQVRVKPVQNSGTLPIICQSIESIEVGSVILRKRVQKPLDSYQDEDLSVLRDKWSDALMRRREYLDQQIKKLIDKSEKSDQEKDREQSLMDQWVNLTEERNAVLVPQAGSGIPGAPAVWTPPLGMEPYIPVLFLDLNADDLSRHQSGEEVTVTGQHSILPKEMGNKFYSLQILQHLDKDVCAVASWDSSIHDTPHLNKVTETNDRVYLILKTTVRLSHPAPMDLVLRKRLALNIYKRQSFTDRIKRRIARTDILLQTGVTYEVVSNIPKASEELEDRESLAQIAASGEDCSLSDGETYIEKYTRGVSAVESILTLDRLRQSVAVKELLQAQGQSLMRKTCSVPNFSQLMRFDMSSESLNMPRSESFADLNSDHTTSSTPSTSRVRSNFGKNIEADIATSPKPFGLARPTFLNLNINLNALRLQQPPGGPKPSPGNPKIGLRMTTLHEERMTVSGRKHSLDFDRTHSIIEEDKQSECSEDNKHDFSEYESHHQNLMFPNTNRTRRTLPASRTLDSLVEFQQGTKQSSTPSTSSSGYGSQAVSSTNLTSDDSMSLKSISVDETPDMEVRSTFVANDLQPVTEVCDQIHAGDGDVDNNHHHNIVRYNERQIVAYDDIQKHEQSDAAEDDGDEKKHIASNDEEIKLVVKDSRLNSALEHLNTINVEKCLTSESEKYVEEKCVEYDSPTEGTSIIKTKLSPGKVVRRRKTSTKNQHLLQQQRASFPLVRPQMSESRQAHHLEQQLSNMALHNGEMDSSIEDEISDGHSAFGSRPDLHRMIDTPMPDWVVNGESVLIRPYNSSGVVAYVGSTEFSSGTWIGVELDAPTGKNDGSVHGVHYFTCRPKHGIFVRADKLIQDRRGRAMRTYKTESIRPNSNRYESNASLSRSRSRGDSLNTMGNRYRTK